MTIKLMDKERFQVALWKVEKLMEEIQDIDKRLDLFSEIKAVTYTAGPKTKGSKHSIVENVVMKRGGLQEEKQLKEFELQLARFDLSSELDRLYSHLWPGTIQMIKDYYINCLDDSMMENRFGKKYKEKIGKAVE